MLLLLAFLSKSKLSRPTVLQWQAGLLPYIACQQHLATDTQVSQGLFSRVGEMCVVLAAGYGSMTVFAMVVPVDTHLLKDFLTRVSQMIPESSLMTVLQYTRYTGLVHQRAWLLHSPDAGMLRLQLTYALTLGCVAVLFTCAVLLWSLNQYLRHPTRSRAADRVFEPPPPPSKIASNNNNNNKEKEKEVKLQAVDASTEFQDALQTLEQFGKPLRKQMNSDEQLALYKFFKQATIGDCQLSGTKKPGIFDPVGSAKFNAWLEVEGLARDEAKRRYAQIVKIVIKKYN